MKQLIDVQVFLLVICVAVIFGAGCENQSEPQVESTNPTQQPVPEGFAITYPIDNDTVDLDIITVKGTGAPPDPGVTVEIDVFTNEWYPQNGASKISTDGTWTYSPCYLKGQGVYQSHHNIRARLMRNNVEIEVTTVYDVAVNN